MGLTAREELTFFYILAKTNSEFQSAVEVFVEISRMSKNGVLVIQCPHYVTKT